MAGACIHGFAAGQCLICQTLNKAEPAKQGQNPPGTGRPERTRASALATAKAPAGTATGLARRARTQTPATSGPRVVPKEAPRSSSPTGIKLAGLAVAVVAVIVVAWVVLHVVLAVLHLLELLGVAILALYVGWVAGVRHGQKTAKDPGPKRD